VRKLFFILSFFLSQGLFAQSVAGNNDTLVVPYIVYAGDTMTYGQLEMVYVFGKMSEAQKRAFKKWTRLRNAVYITYPYAKKAGRIINEVNLHLLSVTEQHQRKQYLSSREKELKKEFTTPLTDLSVYQGKILMKLINRETSNTCYELVKEYRGGFSAHFWQTLAWVFGGSLKQYYDPSGEDAEMERIVKEVARMYGHTS
jgi:hypothetical protein